MLKQKNSLNTSTRGDITNEKSLCNSFLHVHYGKYDDDYNMNVLRSEAIEGGFAFKNGSINAHCSYESIKRKILSIMRSICQESCVFAFKLHVQFTPRIATRRHNYEAAG
jgi:DNA transposition AAA+ family ATPase